MLVPRFIDNCIRKFSHFRNACNESHSYGFSYKIGKKSRRYLFVRKVVVTIFLTKSIRKVVKCVRKFVGTLIPCNLSKDCLRENVGTPCITSIKDNV